MLERFTHVLAHISISFFYDWVIWDITFRDIPLFRWDKRSNILHIPHSFIHLSVDGHLGSFCLLVIIRNTAVNTHVQVFAWTCFHFSGYMPSVKYGLYDNSMFDLLRSCQTVFQSGCIILHCHKQYSLTNSSYYLFYYNHPRGHKVISHCGLDLHFPTDQWYWAFFSYIY